jgi:hypothetical protein
VGVDGSTIAETAIRRQQNMDFLCGSPLADAKTARHVKSRMRDSKPSSYADKHASQREQK